jgi:hypothetical protein
MSTIPQGLIDEEHRPIPTEQLHYQIGKKLIRSLGSPPDLLKVIVHAVGNDRFRVNVLVGKTAGSAKIAHSFFLTADREGNIVDSKPKIVRLY